MSEAILQADLFERVPDIPEGMRYAPELISPDDEHALLKKLPTMPFKEFEFHGFLGKRRVVSFGWHYDFNGGSLLTAGELPGVSLADALEICLLLRDEDIARFERAVVRWHARLCREAKLTLDEAQLALAALRGLSGPAAAPSADALAALCERRELTQLMRVLDGWVERNDRRRR